MRFWRDPLAAVGKGRRHLAPPLPPHEVFPKGRGGRPARLGARVLPYLDDFLFVFASREQAALGARWVRESIEFLGLSCHPTKCQWEPSQSVYHLGITVNTADGLFEVPAEKLAKLRRLAVGLRVTAKKIAGWCRSVSWLNCAVLRRASSWPSPPLPCSCAIFTVI